MENHQEFDAHDGQAQNIHREDMLQSGSGCFHGCPAPNSWIECFLSCYAAILVGFSPTPRIVRTVGMLIYPGYLWWLSVDHWYN